MIASEILCNYDDYVFKQKWKNDIDWLNVILCDLLLQLIYLPPPWGDCKVTPMDSDFFDSYSITACRIDCETRYLVDNCNCRMVHMPGRKSLLLYVESELHQGRYSNKLLDRLQKGFIQKLHLWCECVLLWLQAMRRTAHPSCTKNVLTQLLVRKKSISRMCTYNHMTSSWMHWSFSTL